MWPLLLWQVVLLREVGSLPAVHVMLLGLEVGDEMVHTNEACSFDGARAQVDGTEIFGCSCEVVVLVAMARKVTWAFVGGRAGRTDVPIEIDRVIVSVAGVEGIESAIEVIFIVVRLQV